MPINPETPVTRAAQVGRVLNRHIEAVLLGIGFLIGATTAIVAGILLP